jgi:hypothetical protein
MSMPAVDRGRPILRHLTRAATAALVAVLVVAVVLAVLISPLIVNLLDTENRDWLRLSAIGQAYGAVSALLSAAALCLIVVLQRAQVRHERTWMLRAMHLDVVRVAMDDPVYEQCWGARLAPHGIDERLFYYTNMILMLWFYSWEHGDLSDEQVRNYCRSMFASTVPREYWRLHGDWRLSAVRGRRRRFLSLVDAEYRRAEAAGPAIRPVEQPGEKTAPVGRRTVTHQIRRQTGRRPSRRRSGRPTPRATV